MQRKQHGDSGFTMIEILIVVAIIGIVAAIGIPNYLKARRNAQKNTCIANMKKLEAAVQQWAVEEGKSQDTPVTTSDIFGSYLQDPVMCPAGTGHYILTTVSEPPGCPNEATETDHVLP